MNDEEANDGVYRQYVDDALGVLVLSARLPALIKEDPDAAIEIAKRIQELTQRNIAPISLSRSKEAKVRNVLHVRETDELYAQASSAQDEWLISNRVLKDLRSNLIPDEPNIVETSSTAERNSVEAGNEQSRSEISANEGSLEIHGVGFEDHRTEKVLKYMARIQEYSPSESTDVVFMVGPCDPYSKSMEYFINVIDGESTLKYFEAKIGQLAVMLHAHMQVVASARRIALATALEKRNKRFACADMELSLSSVLQAFEFDKHNSIGRVMSELDIVATAACKAVHDLGETKTKSWNKYAAFSFAVQNFINWASSVVAQIRVYFQVKFGQFIERLGDQVKVRARKLANYFQTVYGHEHDDESISILTLTMAQIYEEVLVPSTNPDGPMERRLKALELASMITKRFGYAAWTPEYRVSESISLTRTFHSYSKDELELLELSDSYFAEMTKDGKSTSTALKRRQRASRMLTYPLFASLAARSLIPHGLSGDDATKFSFALICSPPNHYLKSDLDFLLNQNLISGCADHAYAKKVLDGTVKKILNNMQIALEAFDNSSLFVDITADLRDGTSMTSEALASFFLLSLDEDAAAGNYDIDSTDSVGP